MKATIIEVPQMHDSFSKIIIHGVEYAIRFTYCDTFDYWSFGVYTPTREPIVQGLKIVPNHPINLYTDRTDMPVVAFYCESNNVRVRRYDFRDGIARFLYVEADS